MLDLDDTQRQIADAARRHFEQHGGIGGRAGWTAFVELGWLAAVLPEALGGVGGPVETAVLAEEFALAPAGDPFIGVGVFPAMFAAALADGDDRARLLRDDLLGGVRVVAGVANGLACPALVAREDGDDLRLSGRIDGVVGVDLADQLLVTFRLGQAAAAALIEPSAARVQTLRSIDGGTASAVVLDGATVRWEQVFQGPAAIAALELAGDAAVLAQCAQLLALGRRMLEMTGEHLSTRQQFSQPLAAFQALRHRYADMFAECEQAAAMLTLATERWADAGQRSRTVSACKLRVAQAVRFVAAQAVQLHGAMAMTGEFELGRHYKRTLILRKTWGDEDAHAARMMSLPRGDRW